MRFLPNHFLSVHTGRSPCYQNIRLISGAIMRTVELTEASEDPVVVIPGALLVIN